MQLLALRFLGGVRKGLPAEAQGCPSLWAHRRAQQRDRWPARAQRSLRPGAVAVGLRTRAAPAAGRRLHVLGRAPLREPGSPDFPRRTRALRDRSARRVPEDFESGRCPMPSGRYYARRPRPDDPRRRTRDPTITPNAERWLEELQDEWSGLPDPIRSVAACVRQMENADGAEDQTPRARGRSGRWLVIHGSLTGERDGRATGTAIMLEEAKPSEIAPLIVRAYGLSECETNITRLIPRVYRLRRSRPRSTSPPTRSTAPHVDLRQGRRTLPPRAGRTHPRLVLPAPLRPWRQSARARWRGRWLRQAV